MKFFIDTEFNEYFKQYKLSGLPIGNKIPTIDLISIGIVCENNKTYYALNKECNLLDAWNDEWIRNNVLYSIYNNLDFNIEKIASFSYAGMQYIFDTYGYKKTEIASYIKIFVYNNSKDSNIEFYGYYSDYDWVVFCWLFGRMIDLPQNFPMFCIDLKQIMEHCKLDNEWKIKNCPEPKGEHNALIDALWNRDLYNKIVINYLGSK